jgi:predicted dienelactone hydrolase
MMVYLLSFLIVIFYPTFPLAAMSKAPLDQSQEAFNATGVRTFTYQDEKRHRPVVVELWYPTNWTGPFDESSDQLWVHPKEIRNASFSNLGGNCPLIIMSHGHGGDRRERSWLADRLVRNGFVVAAVDHYGNTRGSFNLVSSLKFWERGRDIIFAIDELLRDPFLEKGVDFKRIGFIGYSLGGMTGLGLGGATVGAIEQAIEKVAKKHKEVKPEMIAQIDLEEAKKPLKEDRIRAMLLICPATFAYQPESLRSIKIPVGLVVATHDEVLPYKEHADLILRYLIPAKLKIMGKNISHYSFSNRISEEGKKFIQKHFYPEANLLDRIHREVGSFAVDFFREFL